MPCPRVIRVGCFGVEQQKKCHVMPCLSIRSAAWPTNQRISSYILQKSRGQKKEGDNQPKLLTRKGGANPVGGTSCNGGRQKSHLLIPSLAPVALLLHLNIANVLADLLENLRSTRVELGLRPDQLGQVAQRLGGIEDVAHNAGRLVDFLDESVLGLLDSSALCFSIALLVLTAGRSARLGSVEGQTGVLHGGAGFVCALQALVESCAPAGEEAGLDLLVLVEAGFADLLLRDGELLEALRQRVGLGGALRRGGRDVLRAGESGAGDCVREGFGLGFGGGGCCEGCLGFGCVGGLGEEVDLGGVVSMRLTRETKGDDEDDICTLSPILLPRSWKLSFTLGG